MEQAQNPDSDEVDLEDLCRLLGITYEEVCDFDVSDLPESTQTESRNGPYSNEPVLLKPDPTFNESRVVDVVADGGILLPSLSDEQNEIETEIETETVVCGDGGCIPFVVQKLVQPRGAPNHGKVKRLMSAAMDRVVADMTHCRKKRKTAYESYCDENGEISEKLVGDHQLQKYSHAVVYEALKGAGVKMRRVRSHCALNAWMSSGTVLMYGSLNMDFQCARFGGFERCDDVGTENDHAILIHHGRIKCVNLVDTKDKAMTLASHKHLVVTGQGKTKSGSYMSGIRTAYVIS